jgi:hypothetical protein
MDQMQYDQHLQTLRSAIGDEAFFIPIRDNGFVVVNFTQDSNSLFGLSDTDFVAVMGKWLGENASKLAVERGAQVWCQGAYGPTHDWVKEPTGAALLSELGADNSPETKKFLLEKRSAFEALIQRHLDMQ